MHHVAMVFDKKYYDDIWGTVHRHDYCETIANQLIAKYNPKSVLDIGTGCGYLVKVLRDKGVKAYGLEISKYAVENSHGNVVQGSVVDIPFKDNSFDVVCSQGLWEYVKEEDIAQAWLECNRVGIVQLHNIDTTQDQAEWSKDFATHKPWSWWQEQLHPPKILVACPTHEVKDYSMQHWIDNVKAFTHPNFDILVVDNSPNGEMINKYGDQIRMLKLPTKGIEGLMVTRINRSMEMIRQEFLKGNYTHWLDIEIDVIPPANVIEVLKSYDGDWISHAYPARDTDSQELVQQGIGCSLLSRKLLEKFSFQHGEDITTPDGYLWNQVRPLVQDYPTIELWGVLKNIKHLSS